MIPDLRTFAAGAVAAWLIGIAGLFPAPWVDRHEPATAVANAVPKHTKPAGGALDSRSLPAYVSHRPLTSARDGLDTTTPTPDAAPATATIAVPTGTPSPTDTEQLSPSPSGTSTASLTIRVLGDATPTLSATPALSAPVTANPSPTPSATISPGAPFTVTAVGTQTGWRIRSIDTMKLSRDTLKAQLSDAAIRAIVQQDARLHATHISVDVYYDDPRYLARWVGAVRAVGLHVWFRGHWYAWENHRERQGSMSPHDYIEATRRFLQQHSALLRDGDIFDFCAEPENGAYWLRTYHNGWSWRNPAAKSAFNTFIRSGIYMAGTTLAHRGRAGVLVTAISVDDSIATRMLSKPTVKRMGLITLDSYPEGTTRDPATATRRLLAELTAVRAKWEVPILLGEHGYARDMQVEDATQARVLTAEFAALARLSYLQGLNYWVDAGGPGYGGYTNLYDLVRGVWHPRRAAGVLGTAYAAMAR